MKRLLLLLLFPVLGFSQTVQINGSSVTGPPPPVYYSISGTINPAMAGVMISITGGSPVTSAADGTYSFTNLANGTYTITPALSSYNFAPTHIDVTINNANETGHNFTATHAGYTISGTMIPHGTVTISGIAMTLNPAYAGGPVSTNASGQYSFTGLTPGPYTVTPAAGVGGRNIIPINRAVTIATANVIADFDAWQGFTVTGSVSGGTPTTGGIAKVEGPYTGSSNIGSGTVIGTPAFLSDGNYVMTVTFANWVCHPIGDAQALTVDFDIAGANRTGINWTCSQIPDSVTPLASRTFNGVISGNPNGRTIFVISGDRHGRFMATPPANTSINSNFIFVQGETYTVTPELPGCTFSGGNSGGGTSRTFTVGGSNLATQNFTAHCP